MGQGNSVQGKPYKGYGYRVLKVEKDSLAEQKDLQIFLDFIVDIKPLDRANDVSFTQLLNGQHSIVLTVYNIYTRQTREIQLMTDENQSNNQFGLTLRKESYEDCLILRVTNVLENSPAEKSGLQKNVDFILGMMSHPYKTLEEFCDIVQGMSYRKDYKAELCVFSPLRSSHPYLITIEPKVKWGGPGILGCEFASGAFHQFDNVIDALHTEHIVKEPPVKENGEDYPTEELIEVQKQQQQPSQQYIQDSEIQQQQKIIEQEVKELVQEENQMSENINFEQLNNEHQNTQYEIIDLQAEHNKSTVEQDPEILQIISPKIKEPYKLDTRLLFDQGISLEQKHVYFY